MGLHNKFPSYFYKRGNLFNTYLSHAEPPIGTARERNPDATARKENARLNRLLRKDRNLQAKQQSNRSELLVFVAHNFSKDGAVAFLRALARAEGVSIQTSPSSVWDDVQIFLNEHVPLDLQNRYLIELKRRKAHGEPLLRRAKLVRRI
jgi:hypothetical protein